jgi:E3 ubiquitin-protein ligase synoviolin
MTEIFLAFTAFRDQFSVTHAVMLLQLLFIKCFHWLLSDRIEAVRDSSCMATFCEAQTLQIDQLPYPGPRIIDHIRLVSLMFILWIIDVVVLTYALDAVMQDGVTIVVLFVNEVCLNGGKWALIYTFPSVCHPLRSGYSLRTEVLPPRLRAPSC